MSQKTKKKGGKILLLLVVIAVAIGVIIPNTKSHKYNKAQDLMEEGQYREAESILEELEDYENAEELLRESRYGNAKRLLSIEAFEEAIVILEELGDYEDAQTLLLEARYGYAKQLMDYLSFKQALEILVELGEYGDCPQLILDCYFGMGQEAMRDKAYKTAISYFQQAGDRPEIPALMDEAYYKHGHDLFMKGLYLEAQEALAKVVTLPADGYPHFLSLEESQSYLAEQAQQLAESVKCYVAMLPQDMDDDKLWETVSNYMSFQSGGTHYDAGNKLLRVSATYYPGQRIVYAWRTGDDSILSADEKEAMKTAKSLVAKAKKKSKKSMDRELYLYNWLCNHVKYDSPNMNVPTEQYLQLRQLTCLGALLDGKANCQGYTDAFYVLGTMAGFDVCKIGGDGRGDDGLEPHSWNGIMLDGKLYIVDVTFGDADNLGSSAKTYTWFNCAYDAKNYSIDGGAEIYPKLVSKNDVSKTYYKYKNSVFTKLSDATIHLFKQYKKNGKGWTFAMVKGKKYTNNDLKKSLRSNYAKAGVRSYSCSYMVETYQGNTYIAIKWK